MLRLGVRSWAQPGDQAGGPQIGTDPDLRWGHSRRFDHVRDESPVPDMLRHRNKATLIDGLILKVPEKLRGIFHGLEVPKRGNGGAGGLYTLSRARAA